MRAFIVAALVAVGSLGGATTAWADTVEVGNVKNETAVDIAGQELQLNGAGRR